MNKRDDGKNYRVLRLRSITETYYLENPNR